MSLLASLFFSIGVFFSASIFSPNAKAATAKDLANTLDAGANSGIEFFAASTSGWSKGGKTVSGIKPAGVPSVNNNHLVGSSPGKANPQKVVSFSFKVRGAGTLSFLYQVSLDDWNGAELCAYEGSYDDGYLWGDWGYWDENMDTGWDWWWEDEIDLGTDTYTHTVTFAILGPSSEDYEKPELDKEWGEVLYNKAWLDNFVWEADPFWQIIEFFPETGESFEEKLFVSLDSDYGNIRFRYTTDGSTPTMKSPLFDPDESDDIEISETTTIKAIAVEGNQQINDTVYEATYTVRAIAPDLKLSQADWSKEATVTFSSDTDGAQFYYTLNNNTPIRLEDGDAGENTFKGLQVTLTGASTVQVMAWAAGFAESDIITQTYQKLAKPNYSTSHPYLEKDGQGTLTITAPAGVTVKYQIDSGDTETYKEPFSVSVDSTVHFQAQKEGMLHSDIVEFKFYKTDTSFELPVLDKPGWSLFFLPGHISRKSSDMLIAQLQPIAYDSQKKIYFRPTLLLGGESYWVFTPNVKTWPNEFFIHPLENITLPAKTWLLSGIPAGITLPLPTDVQAQTWNGKTFKSTQDAGPAWLYNSGNSTITWETQEDN